MKLTELRGIGPKKAEKFEKLGLVTVEDVVRAYPREYEDRRNVRRIADLVPEETAMVRGTIRALKKGRYTGKGRRTLRLLIEDGSGTLEVLFFNAGYIERGLSSKTARERTYWFFGKVSENAGYPVMLHPAMGRVEAEDEEGRILPVYPLTSGLTQNDRRKAAAGALQLRQKGPDPLSEDLRRRNELCGLDYALANIHFPESDRHMRVAKYRLIFEELLMFSLGLGLMKNLFSQTLSNYILDPQPCEEEFLSRLPYELTGDQKDTIRDICRDMTSERRMNRLVQGDVGSGKTVVSAAAIYKVVRNGFQAALMAPTEILAQQHLETFTEFFEGTGIRIRLLTSGLPAAQRREVLEGLAEGSVDLVIGTHAIFGKNVKYRNLALVVTDEQHRFGVAQREALSKKGKEPHILVMTATPIPRTLALVMYGDMDISIIRDKPAGRKEIRTRVCPAGKRSKAYDFLRRELEKGRQAYIVAPLIENSETLQVRSAEEIFEETKKTLAPYRSELIHGRMSPAEKDRVMTAFKNGEVSVLVSTVVIEVGINVPNATVMIIENAERFGLAQMHQLRGRVGRGEEQSWCILVLEGDTEVARQRAQVMEESGDGFVIAEKDLMLRGTGEFFGLRQHGVPEMKIADIYRHSKILKRTGPEAESLLAEDPLLQLPKNEEIRARIVEMYGNLDPGL